jgi:hypothetical protein
MMKTKQNSWLSKFTIPILVKVSFFTLLFWVIGTSHGYTQMNMSASSPDPITISAYAESYNNLISPTYSEIWWYVDGVHVKTVGRTFDSGDHWIRSWESFTFKSAGPGSTRKIEAFARHNNFWSAWSQTSTVLQNVQLAAFQPVNNVKATQGKFQNKVVITWDINEIFNNHSYKIYENGFQVGETLKGVNTYSHVAPGGVSRTYTVRGMVNGTLVAAPAGSSGNTFVFNLQATNNRASDVNLTWNSFSGTQGATGFIVERKKANELAYSPLGDYQNNISTTSFLDHKNLIPGYEYDYRVRGLPDTSSDVIGLAKGKTLPNGTISGKVTTPLITGGVGVSGVKITVKVIGAALPTSSVTEYTTTTGSDGKYQINQIYYYEKADFEVIPSLAGHEFEKIKETVTLERGSPSKSADFIDKTAFTISGTVKQIMDGKSCPMPEVQIKISGSPAEYFTDEKGEFTVVVGSGGNYTLKPVLGKHKFNVDSVNLAITTNTTGINFIDTTTATISGFFGASCNSYAGVATLKFSTADNCFSKQINTQVNSGNFSVRLPAREWDLQVIEFQPIGNLNRLEVLSYFAETVTADITHSDTILDLIYRNPPKLKMEGILSEWTCDFTLPILHQHGENTLTLIAIEEFNGKTCPASSGTITLKQNITSNDTEVQTNLLNYESGDTLRLRFVPGTPNRIAPHKKFIQAILNVDGKKDTIYYDFLVTGHVPREKTFTTVTPEIPFHVLYNPPGDNSYSYLEKGQTISNTITISTQSEDELEGFVRAQLFPTLGLEVGGASMELKTQLDVTYKNTSGSSTTTEDAITITTTATDRFQTSANLNFTGESGDVFVGGALNMIYGITDVVLYDRDACGIVLDTKLVVAPEKFATTFIYTVWHVKNVIVPELTRMRNYYLNLQNDSAEFYRNQITVWEQILDLNNQNKANADFVENLSFSGGAMIERSIETTRSSSNTIDLNFFIDEEVATEAGLSFAGVGVFGGIAVKGRVNTGNIVQNDTINTSKVGFVLSDNDPGDSFTVDVLKCKVHAAPVFKLVSGRSKCPWEPGTLPREGVQIIANTYSQEVELNDPAVFILQLANLSQSDEPWYYDLFFEQSSNPNGAIITVGGSPVVGTTDYWIKPGQGVDVTVTVRKGPTARDYEGLSFSLLSQCNPLQIYDEITLDAYFHRNFNLTVASIGNGSLNVQPGVHVHKEGKVVNLFAAPSAGHVFDKWVIGGQEIFRQAVQVTITGDISATAYFKQSALPQHTLTVEVFGNGTSSFPAGSHFITTGSEIELTALASLNSGFVKWEIDGNEVKESVTKLTVTKNMTVRLFFSVIHLLTVDTIGNGRVTPAVNSYPVFEGSIINLFASPDPGHVFFYWIVNGVEVFTQNIAITVDKAYQVTAVFAETTQPQHYLTVSTEGLGQTMPPVGSHLFLSGQTVSLNAIPGTGQMFDKWIIDGIETTMNPASVFVTTAASAIAYFVSDPFVSVPDVVQETQERILIFPNPTAGRVHIKSEHMVHTIEVFDIGGRIVEVIRYQPNDSPVVDISSFRTGIYFLNIKTEKGEFRHKVIKQ